MVENYFNKTQKLVENFSVNNLITNRSGRACASLIGLQPNRFLFFFLQVFSLVYPLRAI
ncbi:MAG: hypothetical protein QM523_08150 [Candidatus Pacebacteria bacterium]|nr:hypothetical protein [Candidatus Paceibacterota bacterium]